MEETRVLLRNVGVIDPESAVAYQEVGGYEGLKKALSMGQQAIVDEISASGLRGRGGAGFPTGFKWATTMRITDAEQKYIVCNADEGEPGTNKDRFLLTGDPHAVFEGMAIAGKAVGATKGFIYLRAEYSYIVPILENALASARAEDFLGEDILDSGFSFDIQLVSGGGAYVCGEETALLNSMEGKRGEPRQKPPFPGVAGLYGRPTVVNNVETLANVPLIVKNGSDWFRSYGTEKCSGTKLYTISGNVKHPGTYEFPMGANLKDLIYDVCGGITEGHELLAVQTGGASCPVITADQIDVNLDVEQAEASGASLGSGAMIVIDDSNDLIDTLKNIAHFFMEESCGKCTPCREGTKRMYQLISKFADYRGSRADLELIQDLSTTMSLASFCALGQTASTAIATAAVNFPEIFESHLLESQVESHLAGRTLQNA